MPGHVLGAWSEYERFHGPILLGDRLDIWFLSLIGVLSGQAFTPPPWLQQQASGDDQDESAGMVALLNRLADKPDKGVITDS